MSKEKPDFIPQHEDVGCELWPECLTCPYPECLEVICDEGVARKEAILILKGE